MINLAVIGVGSMGQHHARVLFNLENANLKAVVDTNPEQAEKIGTKYNVPFYTDYKEMFEKQEIDAVCIAVPTKFHKETALYALNLKKHVLLEKPIALSEQEAQEIIQVAENNNIKLTIGHIERFNPAIIELKKRIDAGELGEIYKIDAQRISPFPARINDVGVIIDLSVHDIDIINYLTNSEPKRIFAETQQKLHPNFEDSVTAILSYENAGTAVVNTNFLSPTKERRLCVFGKKGMFKVEYIKQELYFYENKGFLTDDWKSVSEGEEQEIEIVKKEPLQTEIEHFIECIQEDKQPLITGQDGLKALKIANLIIESGKEGKVINLE